MCGAGAEAVPASPDPFEDALVDAGLEDAEDRGVVQPGLLREFSGTVHAPAEVGEGPLHAEDAFGVACSTGAWSGGVAVHAAPRGRARQHCQFAVLNESFPVWVRAASAEWAVAASARGKTPPVIVRREPVRTAVNSFSMLAGRAFRSP